MISCFFRICCYLGLLIMLPADLALTQDVPGATEGSKPAPRRRVQPLPAKTNNADEVAKATRLNEWTVSIAGGQLESTSIRYAADLGIALNGGDNLRVLPVVSRGAVGNVMDLLYLKGIDFAVTYADVLDHFKAVEKIPDIEKRISYVMPLFQGEVHILAQEGITKLDDLTGKRVNFDVIGAGANYTGGIVFDRLGIKVERLFANNAIALEMMRAGEIAAIVHVASKPNDLLAKIKTGSGFHFLQIEFNQRFEDYYVPADLTSADYPALIPPGQAVRTISVPAVLAVFNWKADSDRYRRCARFVDHLFGGFDRLRMPPYHTGWRQINLAGTVPGWTRFPPAQAQIDKIATPTRPSRGADLPNTQEGRATKSNPEQERLFQQFLEWRRRNQ